MKVSHTTSTWSRTARSEKEAHFTASLLLRCVVFTALTMIEQNCSIRCGQADDLRYSTSLNTGTRGYHSSVHAHN
jgi:hypothetical protein